MDAGKGRDKDAEALLDARLEQLGHTSSTAIKARLKRTKIEQQRLTGPISILLFDLLVPS
jgi:hypothetical protein